MSNHQGAFAIQPLPQVISRSLVLFLGRTTWVELQEGDTVEGCIANVRTVIPPLHQITSMSTHNPI
jgi:hypothetical protein